MINLYYFKMVYVNICYTSNSKLNWSEIEMCVESCKQTMYNILAKTWI